MDWWEWWVIMINCWNKWVINLTHFTNDVLNGKSMIISQRSKTNPTFVESFSRHFHEIRVGSPNRTQIDWDLPLIALYGLLLIAHWCIQNSTVLSEPIFVLTVVRGNNLKWVITKINFYSMARSHSYQSLAMSHAHPRYFTFRSLALVSTKVKTKKKTKKLDFSTTPIREAGLENELRPGRFWRFRFATRHISTCNRWKFKCNHGLSTTNKCCCIQHDQNWTK